MVTIEVSKTFDCSSILHAPAIEDSLSRLAMC